MDILYLFRHSQKNDDEIRFSLRSVARNVRFIRKVWIFGDCPKFLCKNKAVIECVSWDKLAWLWGVRTPVRSFFLQTFLASLHPELDAEFLHFSDDFIVLDSLNEVVARRERYLEDMATVTNRGRGIWRDALWRTYDILKRLGYGGLNFESHTPTYLTKKRVFEAFRDFNDFVTEDQHAGLTGPTAILNHAYKQQRFPLTRVSEENLRVGFHDKPAVYADIVEKYKGKLFLNFDDAAFSDDMRRFLQEQFPSPCCFEEPD